MPGNFWKKLKEGGRVVGLSPMDGVTDGPFRYMVAKYGRPSPEATERQAGVDVIFTEFVSVDALKHAKEEKSVDRLMKAFIRAQDIYETYSSVPVSQYPSEERANGETGKLGNVATKWPYEVAQVFGSEPELFYQAAVIIATLGFDGMDINMGCPAKSVSENGCGAGLILTPAVAIRIIEQAKRGMKDFAQGKVKLDNLDISLSVKEWVGSHSRSEKTGKLHSGSEILPVSMKTRLGVKDKSEMEDWINAIMEAKPAVLSLHGRTLKQMYTGEADWETIGRAAKIVHDKGGIILGNGDIKSISDLEQKMQIYEVDGGLIGRAAEGNPGVFTGKADPDQTTRMAWMLEHTKIYEKVYGKEWFIPMRKHLAWYTHGFPGAVELRQRLMKVSSAGEVEQTVSGVKIDKYER